MNINELKDMGIYHKALLIGNGNSVKGFDFSNIDNSFVVFGINNNRQPIQCDFIIYYDNNIYGTPLNEYYKYLNENIRLIGYEHNKCDRVDYYYNYSDISFMDSGSHLLQIVSNIMKFKEIYLIGYDYYSEDTIRFLDDKEPTEDELDTYKTCIFDRALHRYNHSLCKCKDLSKCDCEEDNIFECEHIYNLNDKSELKMFPYINLKEGIYA